MSAAERSDMGIDSRNFLNASKSIGFLEVTTPDIRATGRPRRVIVTISPASTRSRISLRCAFACADDGNFADARRDLPFHLVGGETDPATAGGKAVEQLAGRMRRMGFSNLVSTIYPQTRHESLNEVNRNIITADFAAWLDSVVGAR